MGRTIYRRAHTGGSLVHIVQVSTTQGPRFAIEYGWAPGPPWGALFPDPHAAAREADALVQRELHDCRQRRCPDWQVVNAVSDRFAANE